MSPQDMVNMLLAGALTYGLYKGLMLYNSDCDLQLASKKLKKSYFRNKIIWITGASSGIGKQLAKDISGLGVGAKLVLSSRRLEALQRVKRSLRNPDEAICVPLDLAKPETLDEAARVVFEHFEHVDILINNGGVSTRDIAAESEYELDERVMTIDFLSAVKLTKLVLPKMLKRKAGHIVNLSSIAGKLGAPLRTAYCAAKFAIMGYFDALRLEHTLDNVFVTNICPGSVQTNVDKNALVKDGKMTFGAKDPNIANGMPVERCSKLILTATSNKLDEVWMWSNLKEQSGVYIGQYMPETFRRILKSNAKTLMKDVEKLKSLAR